MGINSSSKATGGNFNHIVGPVIGEKVLMNPTLKELNDYGATWYKSEPEYAGKDRDGNTQYIIDFFFKIEPFAYKDKVVEQDKEIRNIRFYMGTSDKVSQSGKIQFVNKFGKFAYADDEASLSQYQNYVQEDVRPALNGEESLYEFVRAFGNFKNTDELQLTKSLIQKR